MSPVCFRAEVNNGKDAGVEDAFKDPDFPHDESSLKNSRFPELLALSSQQNPFGYPLSKRDFAVIRGKIRRSGFDRSECGYQMSSLSKLM